MKARAWIIGLAMLCLCLCPRNSSAGLIFELDGRIDGRRIDAAAMRTDRLEIKSQGHSYAIQLPDGAGALLVEWARRDNGGPLVFSIDDSLVSTDDGSLMSMEKHNYWPPSVPGELALLIFVYDTYAHQVACGATPEVAKDHPLVRLGGERMLPYLLHRTLLDPRSQSPQAYAYRRLAERFVAPPRCVGELTLYAKPGGDDRLVMLE